MEIAQEHTKEINKIRRWMTCPRDFQCLDCESAGSPNVRMVGDLVECLQQEARDCQFSIPFGVGYFCRCPVNYYLCTEVRTPPVHK